MPFSFAAEVLAGELLVLADVGAGDAGDAARGEQDAESPAVDAAVVGDDLQAVRAPFVQGADQGFGDAAEAEAADGERGAVGDVGDRLGGAGADLVHVRIAFRFGAPGRTVDQPPSTTRLAPVM
jgi:hypothetical protein